jgi:CheY-like chemotaxis protein
LKPHPPGVDRPAAGGTAHQAPADSAELAHELDRLRSAGREHRAFIRATRRELRKPLNALTGILRDLSAQAGDGETANAVRMALQWTMSLGRLTNDLLELAVLQADEAEVGALDFDVRDMLDEVAASFRRDGMECSPVTVEIRPEVPSMLVGHPNRIRQILTAGLHHVIAGRNATRLWLGLARISETQTHVDLLFAVHNTDPQAPPLDDEALAKSIESDFGYLVAQRLAHGLGGSLEYLDGGDALQLRLELRKFVPVEEVLDVSALVIEDEADAPPAVPAPAAAHPAPPRPAPRSEAPAQPPATPRPAPPAAAPANGSAPVELPAITLKGMRVLLAGSSGPSTVALQIELRALGCESASAATVAEAHDVLLDASRRMRPFHVCIVDFSGSSDAAEQLIEHVRGEEELRHLQMLLLVEMGASGDAEWAEQIGYAAYMTKPVQRDDLGAVFNELLQRSVAVDPDAVRLVTRHSVRETRRRRLACLIVDDDRVNLILLKTVIERLGHEVEMAFCGTEAVDKAAQRRFDLILSDVRMPDMDGDHVAARILEALAERGERPSPIFAMSANSLPGDSQRCRAAGMRNYFLKPVTLPLLTQLLRYALEDAEAADPGWGVAAEAPHTAPGSATSDAQASNPVPEQEVPPAEPSSEFGEATPIDLDHLEMASVGVPELRRQMLTTFLAEMGAGVERLGDFIADGNHGGAAMLASALTSTSASTGARDCSRLLGEIERRASLGDLASLDTLYAESLAEWDRVRAFASALLEQDAARG